MREPVPSAAATGRPREWGLLALLFGVLYLLDIHLRNYLLSESLTSFLEDFGSLHDLLLELSLLVCLGYFTFFSYALLTRFHESGRGFRTVLMLLSIALAGIFLRSFLEEVVVKAITGSGNYNPTLSWGYYFRDNTLFALTYVTLGTVFFFLRYAEQLTHLQQESQLARREAELKYLRAQVNPHFLFNTLNNLYALVHQGSERSLIILEKLSGMLRYALYEQAERVPIEREVDQLRDLVDLERLRVAGGAHVHVDVGPWTTDLQVPPLLLVPFVENLFKHGELRDPTRPAEIYLYEPEPGVLECRFENAFRRDGSLKDTTGGIGIANVRQRLQLLFPGQHQLQLSPKPDTFLVHLTVRLHA